MFYSSIVIHIIKQPWVTLKKVGYSVTLKLSKKKVQKKKKGSKKVIKEKKPKKI